MKLTIARDELLKPLQRIVGVVDRKQALPILSNVLLDANAERLSLIGTDLEIELTGHSLLSNPSPHSVKLTLPGKKLLDICRALPESAVIELYQERQQIILKADRCRFTLSTLPAEEYPNTVTQNIHLKLTVIQKDFLRLLRNTYFAMAQQDVRYFLNGMLFEFDSGVLRTVSTDGHRLATDTMPVSIQIEDRLQVIVPRKGILELMRLLNDSEHELTLSIGASYIQAFSDDYTFISKLIEGRFPDYRRIIAKNGDKKLVINREELKQALIRAAILSNEKVRGIYLELKPNLLRLLSNNSEQEIAEEDLHVVYSGPEFGLGFNVNYILDVLNTLKSEQVELIFSTINNNSLLITEPNGPKDQAFIVMPMRI